MADCKFCHIDPAVAVDETAECLVFLDYRPVFPGHCLVIPKEHYETLADLPAGLDPAAVPGSTTGGARGRDGAGRGGIVRRHQ